MAQPDERAKRRGPPSSLTAAVLAAVIEKPSHGYEIATRVNRRMGTEWNRRSVYEVLSRLDKEGLLWSEQERSANVRSGWKRVYRVTELGEQTRAAWTHERQALPEGRADIRAWIVFSSPEESEQILAALDEYEKDCMEMAEGSTDAMVRRASWRSRMLNLSRDAVREQLEGEIRWIKRARREIQEYLAESR